MIRSLLGLGLLLTFGAIKALVIVALLFVLMRRRLPLMIYVAVFVVFVVGNLELYFPPYPFIDTRFTGGFDLEKFRMIRRGMLKQEVISLIGFGNESGPFLALPVDIEKDYIIYKSVAGDDKYCILYSDDGRVEPMFDFAWVGIGVCYGGGDRVTRTYEVPVSD